ncbi:hypothetical protein Sste5346_006669 [Sporothrix stenoceras]|uniref:Chitin-binding type-1 domain-containing protein n=1 Tax=Sporothrix stenoceras TaxID=5173 RepID=A0ABR3YX87_9PEZI
MPRLRGLRWASIAIQALLFSAVVSSALQVSPDGTCGGSTGLTCAGSTWGTCCSAHGYCGSGDTYCGKGCDLSAGTCNPGQGTPGGAIASKPTGEEGGGTACPVCPVCTICMSPSPTPVPSTCRLILTATKWETAITTRTVGVANGTAVDMPTQTATSTATITKAPSVTTKTATVTQTLIHTQTETLTVAGTVAADAVSPTPATAATPAAAAVILESTATPSPILPGIVAGCHRWYKTPRDTPGNDDSGGSTCRTVAEAAGISKDDLRLWNTRIGNTSDDTAVCEGPSQLALLAMLPLPGGISPDLQTRAGRGRRRTGQRKPTAEAKDAGHSATTGYSHKAQVVGVV